MASFIGYKYITIDGVQVPVPLFNISSQSDTLLFPAGAVGFTVTFPTTSARYEGVSSYFLSPHGATVDLGGGYFFRAWITSNSSEQYVTTSATSTSTLFDLSSINENSSESCNPLVLAVINDDFSKYYYYNIFLRLDTAQNLVYDPPSAGHVGSVTYEPRTEVRIGGSWYYYENANTALQVLLNDIPPDPGDTDPYSGIDGEGALPGGADVDLPAEPTLSALDAGLFALFSPSASQMRSLASYLWTDFGGTGTDVVAILGEVVEALKRTVSNPLNSMLGLSIIASQGLSKGGSSNVHVGFWDTGVAMTKLTKQYFTVDCGSISFNPVCGDTFLDYAPYSKFSIFLPYVGTRELDANDVVGHTLSVKYRGDCVTGSLVCYLKRDGTIIAEFAGNCALNLPLTADSWGQTLAAAGAIGVGAAKGAAVGMPAAGAVKAAASVATNPSVFSSQVSYTGGVSGGAGHMGSQKPFILREAVRFHSTSHFNSVIGYPAFYYRKLEDCSGYTQVLDVHLHNTPCTGVELKEIEDLLKEGVII